MLTGNMGERTEGTTITTMMGIKLKAMTILTILRFINIENSLIVMKYKNPNGENREEDQPIRENISFNRGSATNNREILMNKAPNIMSRVNVPKDRRIRFSLRFTSWSLLY
jgi:hypothetical protein